MRSKQNLVKVWKDLRTGYKWASVILLLMYITLVVSLTLDLISIGVFSIGFFIMFVAVGVANPRKMLKTDIKEDL